MTKQILFIFCSGTKCSNCSNLCKDKSAIGVGGGEGAYVTKYPNEGSLMDVGKLALNLIASKTFSLFCIM